MSENKTCPYDQGIDEEKPQTEQNVSLQNDKHTARQALLLR